MLLTASRKARFTIFIVPEGSARQNRAAIKEDFPAPVRPTIPIFQGSNKKYIFV